MSNRTFFAGFAGLAGFPGVFAITVDRFGAPDESCYELYPRWPTIDPSDYVRSF